MTIRRIVLATAIAGGSLFLSTAPVFAQDSSGGSSGGGEDTLPLSGVSGDSQSALLVIGAGGIIAGASVMLVRRRSGARA